MPTKREAIAEVVRVVREFHQIGLQSLRDRPRSGEKVAGAVAMEAQKYGLNEDTLRKARTFADPEIGYTAVEVDELCVAIKKHWDSFTTNGATIGRTHIIRLLAVPRVDGQRASVQAAMFKSGWSTSQLEGEIHRRLGRRKRGGRRADLGTNLPDLLGHLDLQCEAWLRLDDQLVRRQEEGAQSSFKDLPQRICSLVAIVTRGMRKLRREIDAQTRPASTRGG